MTLKPVADLRPSEVYNEIYWLTRMAEDGLSPDEQKRLDALKARRAELKAEGEEPS